MQIPINLVDGLCPTLQSSAFAKARIGYFLGTCGIWRYPTILVIDDTDTNKHLRPSMLHNQSESGRPRAIQPDRLQTEVSEHSVSRDKQIAINTFDGRSLKCVTAHYHKVGPRNIFKGFREQAIIVIDNG